MLQYMPWFLLLLTVKCANGTNESTYIINELPCLVSGGTCMIASDCPLENLSDLNTFCPLQDGVVCCYPKRNSRTTCRDRGNECMSRCPTKLIDKIATDCEEGQLCCTLV